LAAPFPKTCLVRRLLRFSNFPPTCGASRKRFNFSDPIPWPDSAATFFLPLVRKSCQPSTSLPKSVFYHSNRAFFRPVYRAEACPRPPPQSNPHQIENIPLPHPSPSFLHPFFFFSLDCSGLRWWQYVLRAGVWLSLRCSSLQLSCDNTAVHWLNVRRQSFLVL